MNVKGEGIQCSELPSFNSEGVCQLLFDDAGSGEEESGRT